MKKEIVIKKKKKAGISTIEFRGSLILKGVRVKVENVKIDVLSTVHSHAPFRKPLLIPALREL